MSACVHSVTAIGTTGVIIDVECHLSNNLPTITIVGLASKAVDEAKERIRGAFADSRIMLPRKRITVNMAPADLPKSDSGFDLAIAVSILAASQQISESLAQSCAFIGELGLNGNVRPVRGIIGKLLAGRNQGLKTFYIPASNMAQARLVPHIRLYGIKTLTDLYRHLVQTAPLSAVETDSGSHPDTTAHHAAKHAVHLSEIVGQAQAKRALEIAAAGGHNVFFTGPPGTGKSMLAKALPGIMPPLNQEEILEVTHLHSLASHNYEQIVTVRPFRAPHHSASHVAIIGGGHSVRPGEISLSHRGVLLFDELPEFGRLTLEALRQPLEDRVVSVARAKDTVEYPANFILVATANPCPCGYYGTSGTCRCLPYQIIRYQQRLSGPILDRIDLHTVVHEVRHDKLLSQTPDPKADETIRQRIQAARRQQRERYQTTAKLNADMRNEDITRYAEITNPAKTLLNTAAQRLNISARAYMRTVKVARTIADLEGSGPISESHISEALAYRAPSTSS